MTAIKTPYKQDGDVDLECYDFLVEAQIKNGVQGLIVCGTTGEGHLMDWEEHLMLIAHSVNKFGDRLESLVTLEATTPAKHSRAPDMGLLLEWTLPCR